MIIANSFFLHAFFSCDQYSIFSGRGENCLRDGTIFVDHIVAIIFSCSVITEFDYFISKELYQRILKTLIPNQK